MDSPLVIFSRSPCHKRCSTHQRMATEKPEAFIEVLLKLQEKIEKQGLQVRSEEYQSARVSYPTDSKTRGSR